MDDAGFRPPTLLGLASYLAGHLSRIGHRALIAELADHDLRLPHFAVLAGLGDFGGLPQHELAERLGLNRSHLVGYLDDLEQRGHLRRTRDTDDRRRQQVELTARGRKLATALTELAGNSEAEQLGMLSPEERATLTDLMRRVLLADDARTTVE